ncbi:MAG TPA: FGGY-family carbohydrate kinase, partial [Clostridia bacterium]|nr:FGGY-family carbohydrate kinase [Clostridia bacterium]
RIVPDVVNSPVILGKYRNRIPVCVAIGDNQAGFMGSGCIDDILVNIGTGSQISLKTDIISIISPDIEIRPLSDDKHIFVGASLCGGRAFAILKSFYEDVIEMAGFTSPENLYDIMLQNMNLPNNESDLVFSTLFCGTRNDPTAKASITNLTADNFTTADITYAALKGISNELYAMYNAIKKYDSSKRIRLIGSGNGIRKNPLLRNILEKTFSMSLSIPVNTEEAAYGAALYALTSTGFFKSVEQAQKMVEFEDEHE